jgi:hypothetical protein
MILEYKAHICRYESAGGEISQQSTPDCCRGDHLTPQVCNLLFIPLSFD